MDNLVTGAGSTSICYSAPAAPSLAVANSSICQLVLLQSQFGCVQSQSNKKCWIESTFLPLHTSRAKCNNLIWVFWLIYWSILILLLWLLLLLLLWVTGLFTVYLRLGSESVIVDATSTKRQSRGTVHRVGAPKEEEPNLTNWWLQSPPKWTLTRVNSHNRPAQTKRHQFQRQPSAADVIERIKAERPQLHKLTLHLTQSALVILSTSYPAYTSRSSVKPKFILRSYWLSRQWPHHGLHYIRLETKSCRISYAKLMIECDRT